MLEFLYISLNILVAILLITYGFKVICKAFEPQAVFKKKMMLVSGLIAWQLYMYIVARSGVLQNYDFPPKFFILLILPAFAFTGIFLVLNRKKGWINAIPKKWLIFYQSIRILIESLFVYTVAKGILHANVTLEGYNFDMIFALTAPIVGYLIFYKKIGTAKLLIYWNYLGLIVIASIIFVFITTIYFPEFYGSKIRLMTTDFGAYPYVLIPGFMMPSAVFIHILSLIQLSKSSR